ncbi:MAG: ScyD/ScyE family protein [Chloroflexota bacterium]|nr:ScyD/ScyE family protein [Chloroflexota bacterium]
MARRPRRALAFLVVFAVLCSFGLPYQLLAQDATPVASPVAEGVTLAADGIPNPRGFLWEEDRSMIVASGGIGGTAELPADESGSIFRIENGCPVTLASGFPSASAFGGRYGISDVALLNGTLYALGDGGFDVTPPTPAPDGLYRINADGSWEAIVNIGAWVEANPTRLVPGDADPGGEPFAMVSDGEAFWISESNHGQILRVTPEGAITRIADLSETHPVPTGLALAPDGGIYVGFLTAAPFTDGSSKVVKVTADGTVTDVWTGLTAVTAVAVAPDGTLYAVEMSTGNATEPPFYRVGTGRVVRQTGPSSLEPVMTSLPQPLRMRFGPDGGLFVAFPAHDASLRPGSIIRLDPTATGLTFPAEVWGSGHCAAPVATAPAATPVMALPTAGPGTTGVNLAPAATVTTTTTTGPTGTGPITVDITIRISVDQTGDAVTVPVTVPVTATTPEAPAAPTPTVASPGAAAGSTPDPVPTEVSGPLTIDIRNFAFNPSTVTVPVGTTVTWTNADTVAHTASANGGAFNSGNLNPGQSYSHTFAAAGTFDYACLYHPYMTGTIIVR